MEFKDFKANDDKTFSVLADGKEVRLVPESDLLALKQAGQEREAQLTTQVAEVTRLRDEARTSMLQIQATNEQLTTQVKDLPTLRQRSQEMETKHGEALKTIKSLEDEMTTRVRENIMVAWNISQDKVKDKPLTELRQMESTLRSLGIPVKPGFDVHGSALGSGSSLTPSEQALADLQRAREKK